MTPADWFHHIVFVGFNQLSVFWPLIGGWQTLQWGSIINAMNFFT
jgi:hypothetical protein